MTKLIGFFASLLILGMGQLARAAEIADAPLPEPNYVGILVFLGIFVGAGGWFVWKIMNNKGDGDKK